MLLPPPIVTALPELRATDRLLESTAVLIWRWHRPAAQPAVLTAREQCALRIDGEGVDRALVRLPGRVGYELRCGVEVAVVAHLAARNAAATVVVRSEGAVGASLRRVVALFFVASDVVLSKVRTRSGGTLTRPKPRVQ